MINKKGLAFTKTFFIVIDKIINKPYYVIIILLNIHSLTRNKLIRPGTLWLHISGKVIRVLFES